MTSPAAVLEAVRSVVGDAPRIGLHEPEISGPEREHVLAALDSGYVSSVGAYVDRFERELADYTGAASAVAVANGTAALHVALVLAGVRPGDLVIVPALSFIATANAVAHAGAAPWFVDSEAGTMGMSPDAVRAALEGPEGGRIRAIVPMHTLGHPVDIAGILAVAAEHGVPVVEDAAESLGSFVGDTHTGRFGALGVLSFNGNKTVTTGGGGAILTDDPELGRRAKHLTTTAKLPHRWEFEHDEIAWNYRMPNLNAALGVAQLSKLDRYLRAKRRLAAAYAAAFADVDGADIVLEPPGTRSNYWLVALRLAHPDRARRDAILAALVDDGVQARPMWNLLSEQRMYRDAPRGPLGTATALVDSIVCLPSSPALGER